MNLNPNLKKHGVRIGIGLALTLCFLGHAARPKIGDFTFEFIDQLDAIIYDARLRLTMLRTVEERIVMVDIDEKSLAEEGRWPWHRDTVSEARGAGAAA